MLRLVGRGLLRRPTSVSWSRRVGGSAHHRKPPGLNGPGSQPPAKGRNRNETIWRVCGRERSSLELRPPPAHVPGWTPRTMRRPTDLYGSERDDRGRRCPPLKIRESYCDTPSRHGCCQPWHPNFCHPHAVVVGAGAGPWCIARKESGCLPVVAAAPNGRRRWLECSAPGSRLGSGRILAPTLIGALWVVINQHRIM